MENMPRMTVDNKPIQTNAAHFAPQPTTQDDLTERYESYVKGEHMLGMTPISFSEFQYRSLHESPTVPPLVARVPDAPETMPDFLNDPAYHRERALWIYAHEKTEPPAPARPELVEGSPLVTAAQINGLPNPSSLYWRMNKGIKDGIYQQALATERELQQAAQETISFVDSAGMICANDEPINNLRAALAAIKPPAACATAADEGSAR